MWAAGYWARRCWAARYWARHGSGETTLPLSPSAAGGWIDHRRRLRKKLRRLRKEALEAQGALSPAAPPVRAVVALGDASLPVTREARALPDVSPHERAIARLEARIAQTMREIAEADARHRRRMQHMRDDDELLLLLL